MAIDGKRKDAYLGIPISFDCRTRFVKSNGKFANCRTLNVLGEYIKDFDECQTKEKSNHVTMRGGR